MRVVVVGQSWGALSAQESGEALARAWADVARASCAVVPMGNAGAGWLHAFAALAGVDVALLDVPGAGDVVAMGCASDDVVAVALEGAGEPTGIPATASSWVLGAAIDAALRAWPDRRELVVDLSWALSTHDAGAGMLAALGASADVDLAGGVAGLTGLTSLDVTTVRTRLAGMDLRAVIPADQADARLLGLRGISAGRGHRAELDLPSTMAADTALEHLARALAPERATQPGAGACGGAGFAWLALGGTLATGPEDLAARTGLAATIARADLVVAGCQEFNFYTRGGDVLAHLARLGAEAGVPVVVVADRVQIGNRETRTLGIEAAHELGLAEATGAELTRAAARVAASWCW